MKAIDRVMQAYSRSRKLTDAEYQQVRNELSNFIQELMLGKQQSIGESKNLPQDDHNGPMSNAT
jgi:hypothetical protein